VSRTQRRPVCAADTLKHVRRDVRSKCRRHSNPRRDHGAGAHSRTRPGFAGLLAAQSDAEVLARLRAAENIGRPLDGDRFMARIERAIKRHLKPCKRGPKPRTTDADDEEQLSALSP
jgi:hypothetical protein